MAASETEKELGTWVYLEPQRWTLYTFTCVNGCRLEPGDLERSAVHSGS
jgi:hypothetical protein